LFKQGRNIETERYICIWFVTLHDVSRSKIKLQLKRSITMSSYSHSKCKVECLPPVPPRLPIASQLPNA
jgi:hypothetical protein